MHFIRLEFVEAVGDDGHGVAPVQVVQYLECIG